MYKATRSNNMRLVRCPKNEMRPTPANSCEGTGANGYRCTKCGEVGHASAEQPNHGG